MDLEKAYKYMAPEVRRRVKACVAACRGMPTKQLERMSSDPSYGCHVDCFDGQYPDACVLDNGTPWDCIYAQPLLDQGKSKWDCKEWRPLSFHHKALRAADKAKKLQTETGA